MSSFLCVLNSWTPRLQLDYQCMWEALADCMPSIRNNVPDQYFGSSIRPPSMDRVHAVRSFQRDSNSPLVTCIPINVGLSNNVSPKLPLEITSSSWLRFWGVPQPLPTSQVSPPTSSASVPLDVDISQSKPAKYWRWTQYWVCIDSHLVEPNHKKHRTWHVWQQFRDKWCFTGMWTSGTNYVYILQANIFPGWWFQTCFIFHNIWDSPKPIDFHIFQDG